ncbi:MAG: class I SAM-dependent methyltransferase [Nitrospirae bacterium]|nr:class I SAM-dependent methyltransferase [Nitrospirota bacterium]
MDTSKYVRDGHLHVAKSGVYGRILDRIQVHKRGGSLLDVGSHVGGFLLLARERGFKVTGVEPSLPTARLARRYGRFKIWSTTFDRAPVKSGSVDVLTLLDVIEHLDDPIGALNRAGRLLRKHGILAIKTPSLAYTRLKLAILDPLRRNVPRWLYLEPGGHLQYFSPRALQKMLNRAGFEVMGVESLPYEPAVDGRWRSRVLNALARPGHGRPSPLARDMLCLAVRP